MTCNQLRTLLRKLTLDLPDLLKLPSQIDDVERRLYRQVLDGLLALDMVSVEILEDTRKFLDVLDQALTHRRRVATWSYNDYWFAVIVDTVTNHLNDKQWSALDESGELVYLLGSRKLALSEEEALEKLYQCFPELR